MIELDGSTGEGGGQILRTALSLALITGQPFRITRIRANRAKPGLMRQHCVAVQAAAQVCGADVGEMAVGAQTLTFVPGKIRGGDYSFAIGTAGSCTLVLQTLLPALLFADAPSVVRITGGTHNSMAPPAHFLQRAYGRVMAQMGVEMTLDLKRFGFYPAGGGEIVAHIRPCKELKRVDLLTRGEQVASFAESFVAGVPGSVAQRELDSIGRAMGWAMDGTMAGAMQGTTSQLLIRTLPAEQGPGNALLITLESANVTDVFCSFGEKTVSAETVAKRVIGQAKRYLASGAALGEYLADQVMLPFALAGGGSFTTCEVSQHSLTNAAVIEQFLPVKFSFEKHDGAGVEVGDGADVAKYTCLVS